MCDVDFESNLVITLRCFDDIAHFVVACCPGTVTAIRRRVGITMNVRVVDAAAPVYVADNDPEITLVASALKDPVEDTSALAGVTAPNYSSITGAGTSVGGTAGAVDREWPLRWANRRRQWAAGVPWARCRYLPVGPASTGAWVP